MLPEGHLAIWPKPEYALRGGGNGTYNVGPPITPLVSGLVGAGNEIGKPVESGTLLEEAGTWI
jgi:hypothetical protein